MTEKTENIQILDKNGIPLARNLEDTRRWRLPDGVGIGAKYSGQIYPLVKTAQGWVIRLGGRNYGQKACQLIGEEATPPAGSAATTIPKPISQPIPKPTQRSMGGIEGQWLANADKAEARRAASAANRQQASEAVAQLHGELAAALEDRDRLGLRLRRLEADNAELTQRLRDDRRLHKCESTLTDLRGQLTYAQRQASTAQAEAKQAHALQQAAEARATANKSEMARQRQETTALEQRLKTCMAATAKGARPEAWGWFQGLLAVAWPRLDVRPESWDTVSKHCTSALAVLRVLQALHDDDPNQASFSISDNGWWEMKDHIATGRDDRLRVYWRPLPERRIEAVIFYKTDEEAQQVFHRALAREG